MNENLKKLKKMGRFCTRLGMFAFLGIPTGIDLWFFFSWGWKAVVISLLFFIPLIILFSAVGRVTREEQAKGE